jgi:hypothetical protein
MGLRTRREGKRKIDRMGDRAACRLQSGGRHRRTGWRKAPRPKKRGERSAVPFFDRAGSPLDQISMLIWRGRWWAQAHPSCLYSVTRYSNLDAKAFCILCPSIAWSGRRLNRSRKAGQDGVKSPPLWVILAENGLPLQYVGYPCKHLPEEVCKVLYMSGFSILCFDPTCFDLAYFRLSLQSLWDTLAVWFGYPFSIIHNALKMSVFIFLCF